LKNITFIPHSI